MFLIIVYSSQRMGGADDRMILAAMLHAVGERGYDNASVQDAVDRAGLSRSTFYRHFKSKEECFALAYGQAAERLLEAMRSAGHAEATWVEGLRAALAELLGFVAERRWLAKALIGEVHAAGGAALAKYEEIVGSLAQEVDLARREPGASHYSPPPLTARFVVATVEFTVCSWLASDSGVSAFSLLPDMVHSTVLYYLGADAARAAFEAS